MSKLSQLRDGVKKAIAMNPTTVTYSRKPLVDDGFGGQVQDPFGTPTTGTAIVRISHEKYGVKDDSSTPTGLSTNLTKFVLMDYTVPLNEGDAIGDWRLGPVDTFSKFGGVYGAQAPLRRSD